MTQREAIQMSIYLSRNIDHYTGHRISEIVDAMIANGFPNACYSNVKTACESVGIEFKANTEHGGGKGVGSNKARIEALEKQVAYQGRVLEALMDKMGVTDDPV